MPGLKPMTRGQESRLFWFFLLSFGKQKHQKHKLWYYWTNSSACCSDWQVRAPIRCQFSMATHPGFFQPFETASQDAPFFLPQCCCDSELLPDGLLTLLEKVWDLKHRRMFYLHITSWAQTHAQNHTHLFQSHVCVSQQSLTESLGCLYAPPFALLTHRLAEQHCLPVATKI